MQGQLHSNFQTLFSYIFAADGLNNIIWGRAEKFCNDGELVDVVLARKEWLALEHFCKNAACTPNIYLHIIFLPGKHNLGSSVVSRGDVAGHLWVLYTGQTKVANLEIAVLVYEDVAGLEIAVHHTGRVDIFQATLSELVQIVSMEIWPRTKI